MKAGVQLIRFYEEAIDDREATTLAGAPRTKCVDFIEITNPGGKDVFIKQVDENVIKEYTRQYESYKAKQDPQVEGTRLKDIPLLTGRECSQLSDANIFTVEQLAGLSEAGLTAVGMGARNLQKKAADYLKAMGSNGKFVQEMNDLRVKMQAKDDELAELRDAVATLTAEMKADKAEKGKKAA